VQYHILASAATFNNAGAPTIPSLFVTVRATLTGKLAVLVLVASSVHIFHHRYRFRAHQAKTAPLDAQDRQVHAGSRHHLTAYLSVSYRSRESWVRNDMRVTVRGATQHRYAPTASLTIALHALAIPPSRGFLARPKTTHCWFHTPTAHRDTDGLEDFHITGQQSCVKVTMCG